MYNTEQTLDRIIEQTGNLIELCSALQEENDLLKLENQSMGVALNTSKDKSVELEERVRVLKLARSLEGASEKTLDIKQKINDFVREIDKSLVLLKGSTVK